MRCKYLTLAIVAMTVVGCGTLSSGWFDLHHTQKYVCRINANDFWKHTYKDFQPLPSEEFYIQKLKKHLGERLGTDKVWVYLWCEDVFEETFAEGCISYCIMAVGPNEDQYIPYVVFKNGEIIEPTRIEDDNKKMQAQGPN